MCVLRVLKLLCCRKCMLPDVIVVMLCVEVRLSVVGS